MLELKEDIKSQIIKHAINELPNEACGLFSAPRDSCTIDSFYPMQNIAKSAIIYQLDPLEMMKVEATADARGTQIIGVMHSHTHTHAYPSPTDVRDATEFDPLGTWHYLIVSLQEQEPVIRSFRIKNEMITEEEISFRSS
jgi:proteasome lid subunit RPN8/RPN11